MKNARILPRLAVSSISNNRKVYAPYIFATALCVAVFFIFVSIRNNRLMDSLMYAGYFSVLMIIGEVLLIIILAPFLISINNFFIKQRKKEIGLYSLLGLEKKHIGFMLFIESLILYASTMGLGLITASVFCKLVFMLLLKITKLPLNTDFSFCLSSFIETLIFFGVISLINFFINLISVSKASPTQLFSAPKQGEKEPKTLIPSTIIGVLALGIGYFIALKSKMNVYVYTDFLLAVTLVIIGTYMLFKSISVSVLKMLRKNKNLYYKSKNFVTISGMLYRMRKNSNGLANICIFGTMTIITVIFTMIVFFGQNQMTDYMYPYDYSYYFNQGINSQYDNVDKRLDQIASDNKIDITDKTYFGYKKIEVSDKDNIWVKPDEYSDYTFRCISLDDYNKYNNSNTKLDDDEVLIFTNSANLGLTKATINGKTYKISELDSIPFSNKSSKNIVSQKNYLIFGNQKDFDECTEYFNGKDNNYTYILMFNVPDIENQKFGNDVNTYINSLDSHIETDNKYDYKKESTITVGGLLFIGVFFGIIFIICMILIMYYNQITEGYEDKHGFEIMKNVGMSEKEVKGTVSKQILIFFFLPLLTTICHTAVALNIITNLMATLNIFSTKTILTCSGITVLAFSLVYALAYTITKKAYYNIVK